MRTAFVEECRQEWRRLGVPDGLADEMASELEADLAEAQADGVSAAELLGESDPRRFAAIWARERGLVAERAPQKRRRRIWPWVVGFVVFFVLLLSWLALQTLGSSHTSVSRPPVLVTPVRRLTVPDVVGLKACRAVRVVLDAGLIVRHVPRSRCNAVVAGQQPAAGTAVRAHAPRNTVKLRLRG